MKTTEMSQNNHQSFNIKKNSSECVQNENESLSLKNLINFKYRDLRLKNVENNFDKSSVDSEDDICAKGQKKIRKIVRTAGLDPRFQQQDQTLRCYVMYSDFFRCEKILGEGHDACKWFKHVYTTICPNAWIEKWDGDRAEKKMAWHRYRQQEEFPGDRYGI